MNAQEPKRLRELTDNVMRSSTFGMDSAVKRALLAAIEPYRAALAVSRQFLVEEMENEGLWSKGEEQLAAIDALLGEP